MECIHCGCTEDRACPIQVASLPADRQFYIAAAARHMGVAVPASIGCSWFETDPPVCSAPACVAKHTESLTTRP